MIPKRKPFELPMTTTISLCSDEAGMFTAHALDFDLACVGASDGEAYRKVVLAIKTYIEFGLSNGWDDDIIFHAPDECWDKLENATINLGEPIQIMDRRMRVYRVTPHHEAHEIGGVTVSA